MLCSICTTKGENMSFCNLFNTGNGCGCGSTCRPNYCGCGNTCPYRWRYATIPTNTIPRPPIIPPPIPILSSLGTYNATSGEIAAGGIVPLGTQYTQSDTDITYSGGNTITLSDGVYRVSYSASATGTVGTASLTLNSSGSPLPQSTSTASLEDATDIRALGSSIIVDAQTTPITLTLNNSGTTAMTYNNISLNATQIR